MSNDIEFLKHLALEQGWTIANRTGNKLRWQNPKGESVNTGKGAQSRATFYNTRAKLLRLGLILPEREESVAKQQSLNRVSLFGTRERQVDLSPGVPITSKGVDQILPPAAKVADHPAGLALQVTAAIDEKVAAATERLIKAGTESVELALLACASLEDRVNVVADAVAARSLAWDGTIPQLRADVRALKERPVAVPYDPAPLLDQVGREILSVKVAFDEQLAAFKDELVSFVAEMLVESEAKLVGQIQAAQATVDPLAAIRKRLGQS